MKRSLRIAIASLLLAIACGEKDTKQANVWHGMRLTLAPRPAGAADCGDLILATHADAVSYLERCPDQAIAALERLSERDNAAASDLAAAYAVRAQRQSRPSDYLRAWNKANAAAALPEAQFNRGQIEEILGLRPRNRPDDALVQWTRNAQLLHDALRKGDRVAVAHLIRPFPYAAELFLAGQFQRPTHTPAELRLLGEELSRLTGDAVESDAAATLTLRILEVETSALKPVAGAYDRAADEFEQIERDARGAGYRYIGLRALVEHAWARLFAGRYIEALADYDNAIAEYERLNDLDAATDTRMRRISALRGLGQYETAWDDAFSVISNYWRWTQARSRETFLNDIATTVQDVGFPKLALRYIDAAIAFHRGQSGKIAELALASAFGVRAKIESSLGLTSGGERDLDESNRRVQREDARARDVLQARNEAVRGELLLRTNPAGAVSALSAAIAHAPELPTIRATLHFQRAEARLALGQGDLAENDFKAGLDILRSEESQAVKSAPAAAEPYWSGYFSRFQTSSRRFIGYLVDRHRWDDAFNYAEQTRAFEPLSKLMDPADVDAITPEQIRAELPADTLLLEYCVLQERTIVWTVSREGIVAAVLPGVTSSKAERWSHDTRDSLATVLNAASAELLPRDAFARGAARLVIVPDGPLHALPFAALRNPLTGRYLVEDYPIAIAGSAKLYLLSLQRSRELERSTNDKALLIGNPAMSAQLPFTRGLPALPRAQSEVDHIASSYEHAEKLVGADATVPRFFERAPGAAVIHIAAHAIPNPAQPLHSIIVLAPSAHDSGALDAEQLHRNLTLKNTRLVVLSACSSAGGLPIGPEGLAPLVRPLIAAGVPAVIGSLWDVKDATAEALLVSFHRHYGRDGFDAASAMRAAQIEMIGNTNNPGFQRPMAWAAFEVIGFGSSPAARRNN